MVISEGSNVRERLPVDMAVLGSGTILRVKRSCALRLPAARFGYPKWRNIIRLEQRTAQTPALVWQILLLNSRIRFSIMPITPPDAIFYDWLSAILASFSSHQLRKKVSGSEMLHLLVPQSALLFPSVWALHRRAEAEEPVSARADIEP